MVILNAVMSSHQSLLPLSPAGGVGVLGVKWRQCIPSKYTCVCVYIYSIYIVFSLFCRCQMFRVGRLS